jgi:hypothetical protein
MACTQGTPREKFLGTVVSILVGLISTGILFLSQAAGASVEGAVVYASILGNFIGYSGDILIAKQCFDAWDADLGEYVPVKFDQWDVEKRFVWYVKSLASKSFLRFILTVLIDIIVSLAIIDLITQLLDDLNINFGIRDTLIAGIVSVFTFQVFVNEIRFNYAYNRSDNFTHDLIVFAWASILIVIYILLRKLNAFSSKNFIKSPVQII